MCLLRTTGRVSSDQNKAKNSYFDGSGITQSGKITVPTAQGVALKIMH